jgi:hypothetical protein
MTSNEHALIIAMFTKQARQIKVLSDVLKSNGILQGDDLEAFTNIVDSDPVTSRELSIETVKEYMETVKNLDVIIQ